MNMLVITDAQVCKLGRGRVDPKTQLSASDQPIPGLQGPQNIWLELDKREGNKTEDDLPSNRNKDVGKRNTLLETKSTKADWREVRDHPKQAIRNSR
ncbi:hypothetical protein Dda_2084 [Drechslerella dactyloides]|uniref:Uncharacterized protein n=1 Tax=Drechslerella dactyloides TaxID=74499 RepID=A0AAD6J581_DREDA|nr:hypothetical protein Dda_2084 [Drechslerella dactyloides]